MQKFKKVVALLLMISGTLVTQSLAASLRSGYSDKTVMIGLNDYGWTAFKITATMTEEYEKQPTRVLYSTRLAYITVQSSRSDSGINLAVMPLPRHYNRSTNATEKTFRMLNESHILPGDISEFYIARNSDPVYYSPSNNYASGYGFSLSAIGAINPYGDRIEVNLSV